jgi:cell division protein FtsB
VLEAERHALRSNWLLVENLCSRVAALEARDAEREAELRQYKDEVVALRREVRLLSQTPSADSAPVETP